MITEDDKFKELFNDFHPNLSSGHEFMDRLRQNMKAVEAVKAQSMQSGKRTKTAIIAAAAAGFAAGVATTLAMPFITSWISSVEIPSSFTLPGFEPHDMAIACAWLAASAISLLITFNAYSFSLYLQTAKSPRRQSSLF